MSANSSGTVLVVNDTPDQLELMSAVLRHAGYHVLTAVDGREGFSIARRERPRLIISDVLMPWADGIELCQMVRADPVLRLTPILLVSAVRKDAESAVAGLKAGADDYLEAPYDPAHLLTKVARLVERARAEEALRESEERFRLLVEGTKDYAIFMLDPRGVSLRGIRGAERINSYRAEEIIGEHFSRLYTPEAVVQGRPERELEVAAAEGQYEEEGWRVRRDGTRYWAHVVTTALTDAEGRLRGFSKVTRDVTERRRAEVERERFFAVGADLLLIADLNGRFRWLSPAWERALGWSTAELTSTQWLHFVHPEDRERAVAEAERIYSGQETVSFENRYRHKDGSYRWISWRVRPYLDEQSLYGAAADVTERRRLEEQFRQSQKLESVGQLAGGVAHDFNNLLTIISGYSDLLLGRYRLEDAARSKVEEIRKAAGRASSLTRQLLAFSRKQILEPKILDLTETVANMDKMLQRLIGEDVHLVTVLEPKLEKVSADPGQVEQVLMNLAVNARDAMPRGGKLTIETKNVYLDEAYARRHVSVTPGRYVMLAVSDTGAGMDAETQERIFEPFFTTKGPGKGTGLGLSTVYGIVKQSGGNIWLYSEPGIGTTFKVYLPVAEGAVITEVGAAPAQRESGTETVLLVEDEEAVRLLLLDILESEGYRVLAAGGGDEAVEASERHVGLLDLLITDVVMPRISGRDLVERMKQSRPDMKVIFMSGYTDNAVVHHGVLDPGVNFLQKPFTPDAVLRKVREVLDAPGAEVQAD